MQPVQTGESAPTCDSYGVVPASRDNDFLLRMISFIPYQIKARRSQVQNWTTWRTDLDKKIENALEILRRKGKERPIPEERFKIAEKIQLFEIAIPGAEQDIQKATKSLNLALEDFQIYSSEILRRELLSASEILHHLAIAELDVEIVGSISGSLQKFATVCSTGNSQEIPVDLISD